MNSIDIHEVLRIDNKIKALKDKLAILTNPERQTKLTVHYSNHIIEMNTPALYQMIVDKLNLEIYDLREKASSLGVSY